MNRFSKKYPKTGKFISNAGKALAIANQAYKTATFVASIINSEKKFYDENATIYPDTTYQANCLTNMAQGDTNITRTGNSIALKSFHLKGVLKRDSTVPGEIVRVMLVLDKDNAAGTIPNITDVVASSGVYSFRNMDYARRFTVLMDRTYTYQTDKPNVVIEFWKKFYMKKDKRGRPVISHHCLFDGSTANNFTRNHIYLYVIGNTATGSTASDFTYSTRIRFYDN